MTGESRLTSTKGEGSAALLPFLPLPFRPIVSSPKPPAPSDTELEASEKKLKAVFAALPPPLAQPVVRPGIRSQFASLNHLFADLQRRTWGSPELHGPLGPETWLLSIWCHPGDEVLYPQTLWNTCGTSLRGGNRCTLPMCKKFHICEAFLRGECTLPREHDDIDTLPWAPKRIVVHIRRTCKAILNPPKVCDGEEYGNPDVCSRAHDHRDIRLARNAEVRCDKAYVAFLHHVVYARKNRVRNIGR